ncbi:MAG: ATP synthase F1 subunit delta [Bacteroidales bacterium]|nr:ATP synthase F1 subunit delta [Bacteroidales bacterium]
MATDSRIGVRYARALYAVAKSKGNEDKVRNDLSDLLQLMTDLTEFDLLINTPMMKGNDKAKLLTRLFKNQIQPLTLDFLLLLTAHRRESALGDACRMYESMYKQEKGIVEARITSVIPLRKNLVAKLVQWIEEEMKKKVELQQTINENLIGGFILRMDDRQLDVSISDRLQKIRQDLLRSLPHN